MPYQVLNLPNVYGISNPQLWVIEKRPEVTWMPWFAIGSSRGRAELGQGDMAAVYEEQIRTLVNNARELPDAQPLLNHASVCYAQVATLRSAIQPQDVAARTADVEKCISAFRTKIEAAVSAASAPAPKTEPAPSLARVPGVVWALGASAILGVIAYAATRR
jgi:hypothetical protein